MDPTRKCGDGLGRGVHVGGFGVVVVVHAVDGGDVFQAVLNSFECFDGCANGFWGNSCEPGSAGSSQHIFHVVMAFKRNVLNLQNEFGRAKL